MPDWERLVAERLAPGTLAPEVQREVVVEIAAHLDECHGELLQAGSADPEGQTLAQVADWSALCRNIRRSREDPMSFIRRVVMPGVAAVILALAAIRVWVYLLVAPEPCPASGALTCVAVKFSAHGPAYLPWLTTLLLAAAMAAGLARWMGARSAQRLLAAMLPVIYFAGETVVFAVLGGFFWRIPIYFVVIPAIVCAIGASPFLGDRHDPVNTRSVATHP